jgi:hypothetical protein
VSARSREREKGKEEVRGKRGGGLVASNDVSRGRLGLRKRRAGGGVGDGQGTSTQLVLVSAKKTRRFCKMPPHFGGFSRKNKTTPFSLFSDSNMF